ncbi:MAG: signal peptidase II [Oscillospiraceae bacterium]|nr:signal peptidase II [Oscillospiraceae bacterium]
MFYAIVAVILLILDQMIKYWATVNIVENTAGYMDVVPLIPGLVRLTNFHNSGAAFSFLAKASWARWFFVILCLIFVAVVVYALLRDLINTPVARWAAVIVMTGAIGNCIDRIISGYVVDMIEFDFTIFGHRFPVFNMADIYITVGAIVFIISILLEKPKAAPAPRQSPAPEAPEGARSHVAAAKVPEIGTFRLDEDEDGEETAPQPSPASAFIPQPVSTPAASPRQESAKRESSKTEHVMRTLVAGRVEEESPAPVPSPVPRPAPAPEEAPPPAPPKTESPEGEYSLDDILAEFRDL